MKDRFRQIALLSAFLISSSGCFKDLDTKPIDPDELTADVVYQNPANYRKVLAKLYAGLAVTGQQGPAGNGDIKGIDEGFGQYLRMFWYHQELTTDEAVIGWNDQTIKDFHYQNWSASDGFIYACYSRIFYQVSLANEFLRETTDAKLAERGNDDATKAEVKRFRAEARFLRALSYWHALDLFRNPPFADENDIIGTFTPQQITPQELFAYLEKELKEMDADLAEPRANEYARADKGAAWMLLAKLYLNAEVYIGQAKWTECAQYCDKLINAGYELEPQYKNLFLADNNLSKEIIFPVAFDGNGTRTWGGMTFIIRAGIGGTMNPVASGVVSGWGGTRTTRQLIEKFPTDLTGEVVNYNQGRSSEYARLYCPGTHQGTPDATQTDNALATTTVPSNKIFEGHLYFENPGVELRFTQTSANDAPQLGDNGADGKLETNGAAIKIPAAGMHFFKVNLSGATKTYTVEKRDFSIVGTATGGQQIPMVWDAASKKLIVARDLAVGSFKFVINGDAAKFYGDNGADALLETGGAEIAIAKSGSYKISLDIDRPDYTYEIRSTGYDRRGLFYSDGQALDINNMELFTDGYAVQKFKNVSSTGKAGKNTDFPDTDFPMFRLADVYLMAAEALLRGNGDKAKALAYFNKVRERAYTSSTGNFDQTQLTLPAILDERARELYWECHRRTDLVRFGQLTDGSYLWAWKGSAKEGATVSSDRNIFPIPTKELGANPSMHQNKGY